MTMSVSTLGRHIISNALQEVAKDANATNTTYEFKLNNKKYHITVNDKNEAVSASLISRPDSLWGKIKSAVCDFFGISTNKRLTDAFNSLSDTQKEIAMGRNINEPQQGAILSNPQKIGGRPEMYIERKKIESDKHNYKEKKCTYVNGNLTSKDMIKANNIAGISIQQKRDNQGKMNWLMSISPSVYGGNEGVINKLREVDKYINEVKKEEFGLSSVSSNVNSTTLGFGLINIKGDAGKVNYFLECVYKETGVDLRNVKPQPDSLVPFE